MIASTLLSVSQTVASGLGTSDLSPVVATVATWRRWTGKTSDRSCSKEESAIIMTSSDILDDDDTSTVYQDASANDLTILTSALLLTADCMGTGILALPADVQTLGRGVGLAFLIFNLPVNLYAGTILSWSALFVEEHLLNDTSASHGVELANGKKIRKDYSSVQNNEQDEAAVETKDVQIPNAADAAAEYEWTEDESISEIEPQHERHTDTATFDFVGMTSILFDESILPNMHEFAAREEANTEQTQQRRHRFITYNLSLTKLVLLIYYINLFLVLGNYILVMSHAVSAMAGEDNLCIPTAGIVASTIMLGLSQLRTMANLGRCVSFISLLALFIVVLQCLHALRNESDYGSIEGSNSVKTGFDTPTTTESVLSKMSSIAAIGFAVGSQKLLLNIRHEMGDRTKAAPQSLSIALSLYGFVYIVVCLLAGPTPPSFLFDAIPVGSGRRIAGFLLWIHVSVSYAINSQALCSSLDRMMAHSAFGKGFLSEKHRSRWFILTASVAVTSYFVANAVPFFKDLVALCGALTSVPLTLLLPAVFYRRIQCVPLLLPTLHSKSSYALVMFSIIFMIIGLIGAIGSIDVDWENKREAFSCQ